jgi:hypothetical protein
MRIEADPELGKHLGVISELQYLVSAQLSSELRTEPSPALRSLRQSILTQAPELDSQSPRALV